MTKKTFHPYLLLLFLDPGPGMGKNQGWVKIRIRDKHPGSATLPKNNANPCGCRYATMFLGERDFKFHSLKVTAMICIRICIST
jgi:hypothetical protein